MKKITLGNSLILLLTACIWGVAFVAQSVGMDYMGPLTFTGLRFLMGGILILPLAVWRWRFHRRIGEEIPAKITWKGGCMCGLALCTATLLQQWGLLHTTVGKAGFLTALYIIIVPVLGLFLGKKVGGRVWICAGIAVFGLYLLCLKESFSMAKGDLLVLICAVLFSLHILIIDRVSPKTDGVVLSCIQFFVAGVIGMTGAFLWEAPSVSQIAAGLIPLAYAGFLSSGVAYTLQIIGQKNMDPTAASLILSLESVISVLAGWLILDQRLSGRELLGCGMVFAAVILVQLPERKKQR